MRHGAQKIDWPSDEVLLATVRREGNFDKAAEALGVGTSTFRDRLTRQNIIVQAREARTELRKLKREQDFSAQISEEEKLSQRVKELEGLLSKKRKDDTYEERVLDRLEGAARIRKPAHIPRPTQRDIPRHEKNAHEFALLFSDTHAGELVSGEETLGINQYDWKIMLRRMAKIRDAVISYQDHRAFPVAKLHIWMLGDMLSGSIHEELAITNELPDEEATVQFAYDCADWLETFLEHFESVHVCGVPGNHPRKSKKPAAKRVHNNSDWTAYQMMSMYHRHTDRISFDFPRAAFYATTVAQNWRTLLMHGDGIRSTMPGVPWGGVIRRITVLEQQFAKAKQPLDYVALGHFHTANTLDGVGAKAFLNGSVKGPDEYSLKQFGSGRPASQLLLTFHKTKGHTDSSVIDCESAVPASSPPRLP